MGIFLAAVLVGAIGGALRALRPLAERCWEDCYWGWYLGFLVVEAGVELGAVVLWLRFFYQLAKLL